MTSAACSVCHQVGPKPGDFIKRDPYGSWAHARCLREERHLEIDARPDDLDGPHEKLAREIGALVDKKAASYGGSVGVDSLARTAEYLKLLWPSGIPVDAYTRAAYLVRDFDKSARIATDAGAFGEDPYADKAGYALRMVALTRGTVKEKP